MLTITPLSNAGGVILDGIDLAQPLDDQARASLRQKFDEDGLLLLRGQKLTKQQLVAATYALGEPEIHPLKNAIDREAPEILILSTHGRDGEVPPEDDEAFVGLIDWHTDLGYMIVPNRGTLLYGVHLPPEGGMTASSIASGPTRRCRPRSRSGRRG